MPLLLARAHYRPLLLLLLLVLVANAPILTGAVNCDPETFWVGLFEGWMPDRSACFLDPAVALYTQPLGHLAAEDWLHGVIPWWTPYTGAGMPLAAQVQDEAFFLPFVLLLHFHAGWFIQRLLFQFCCGAFTYAFLRRIGLGAVAALFGGTLFALNGTFYLNPGTVSAPMMFQPLLMIGFDQVRCAALASRRGGWGLITLATAGGIYAGFPEVAFFSDLLGLCWVLLLLAQAPAAARWRLLGKTVLGGAIGLALTAPMVVPFLQYLQNGDTGLHTGGMARIVYPAAGAPLQMLPLFYGAIAQYTPAALMEAKTGFAWLWGMIGGWFGCTPVLLALAALLGRTGPAPQRALRRLLGIWVVVWEARCFGAPGVIWLVNLVPGIGLADATRYAGPSLEFALFTLAACGLDDVRGGVLLRGRRMWLVCLIFVCCVALSILPAAHYVGTWFQNEPQLRWLALANLLAVTGATCLALRMLRTGRHLRLATGLILAGAVIIFMIPELDGLHETRLDRVGLDYLRQNIGLNRMFSVGPLPYNIPAQWNIASVNSYQLPSPRSWDDYYQTALLTVPLGLTYGVDASLETRENAAVHNLPALAAAGVKYIAVWPFADPLAIVLSGAAPPLILPTNAGAAVASLALAAGQSVSGTIAPLRWAPSPIYALTLRLGTFRGQASGPLRVVLCTPRQCANAQSDLSTATDNASLSLRFQPPLPVRPGDDLRYTISHPAGRSVALWLAPAATAQHFSAAGAAAGTSPVIFLQQSPPSDLPELVSRSPTTLLYALPNAAAYAQAADACNLVILSRTAMRSNCAAPASLIRRELFYPGWRATINGAAVAVGPGEKIFQQVALPAGPADIRFTYRPPFTRLSCALALAALLLWGLCLLPASAKSRPASRL